jgi:hypothetical protein
MARKSKPWAVVLSCSGSPIRSEHRSEAEAYRKVRTETAAAKAGRTTVSRIRVEQWEPDYNRWALYELINPKES